MSNLCACGCGESAPDDKRFRKGHYVTSDEFSEKMRSIHAERRAAIENPNPSGLCLCGCGEKTAIAPETNVVRGRVKGCPMRYIQGHHMRGKHGADHPQWGGGRYVHKSGYVLVLRPDHPRADVKGYVPEHRLIVEETLGRPLAVNEDVHHINGVKHDNRPENLVALTKADHHRLHGGKELTEYHRENPEKNSEFGRKGAAARWTKTE